MAKLFKEIEVTICDRCGKETNDDYQMIDWGENDADLCRHCDELCRCDRCNDPHRTLFYLKNKDEYWCEVCRAELIDELDGEMREVVEAKSFSTLEDFERGH